MTAPDISPEAVASLEKRLRDRKDSIPTGDFLSWDAAESLSALRSALTAMEAPALRAEDACEKDGKARAEAGGMQMEIDELRSSLTASEKRIAELVAKYEATDPSKPTDAEIELWKSGECGKAVKEFRIRLNCGLREAVDAFKGDRRAS